MTIVRIHSVEKYIGESIDVKPIGALVGSEFYERDTQNTYIVYSKMMSVANWVLKKDK